MTRIPLAPAKGLFRREVYRQTRKRWGREVEPLGVMAHRGSTLAGVCAMELAIERSKKVDEQIKALASTKVALLVGCEFCIDIGSFVTSEHGVPDEKLLALPDHRAATCFDERELAVLDYAEAMTRTPAEVTDEIFARVREHFDDAQLVELTGEIAWENWRARFNWAFDIGAAGFTEGRACPIPLRSDPAPAAASAGSPPQTAV
jgi:alkylhydroperoxidase family enzyme